MVKTGESDGDSTGGGTGGSTVLDVGRLRRTISPALMRALLVRDGGCRFPGCCSKAWLEAAGRIIEPAPAPAVGGGSDGRGGQGALASLAAEQRERGVAIDRTTSLPAGDGTTPDIGAAVSALWWREDRRSPVAGAALLLAQLC